jgi:hypothetical protein
MLLVSHRAALPLRRFLGLRSSLPLHIVCPYAMGGVGSISSCLKVKPIPPCIIKLVVVDHACVAGMRIGERRQLKVVYSAWRALKLSGLP